MTKTHFLTTNNKMDAEGLAKSAPAARSVALSPASIAWAIFLGMSWTWCIGMFLPVILVRDFGVIGWVVFAIPNVIGAAAMGWTLRHRQTSREMVRRHALACQAFSLVTIAFHFFFASWIIGRLVGFEGEIVFLAALGLFYVIGRVHPSNDLSSAVIVFLLSLVAMGVFLLRAPWDVGVASSPDFRLIDLVGLSVVCVFGFAFCPYLDLTFHRTRRSNDGPIARPAFGLGFGVFFLLMIVYSLIYASQVGRSVFGNQSLFSRDVLVAWAVAGHMAVQAGFTIAVHQRELRRRGGAFVRQLTIVLLIAGVLFVLRDLPASMDRQGFVQPVLQFTFTFAGKFASMTGGELFYRLFMSFYGLFFPTYVWLCIVPAGGILLRQPPVTWMKYAVFTLIALPLFYMGFIEEKYFLLIPGLLILLFARAWPLESKRVG